MDRTRDDYAKSNKSDSGKCKIHVCVLERDIKANGTDGEIKEMASTCGANLSRVE